MTVEDNARNFAALVAAGSIPSAPPDLTVADYGEAAHDLETLRRLLAQRCPAAQFVGFTDDGARRGEYRFRLPPVDHSRTRSAIVQAPVTRRGKPRAGGWRFRLSRRYRKPMTTWLHARNIETVVGWICRQAEWPYVREV